MKGRTARPEARPISLEGDDTNRVSGQAVNRTPLPRHGYGSAPSEPLSDVPLRRGDKGTAMSDMDADLADLNPTPGSSGL